MKDEGWRRSGRQDRAFVLHPSFSIAPIIPILAGATSQTSHCSSLPPPFSVYSRRTWWRFLVTPYTLQPYDLLMVVVIFICTLFGAWKGVAWQVAALASVVVSSLVAIHSSGPLAPLISAHEPWNRFFAMLALYIFTSLTIWMAFRLLAGIIDRVQLKEFDRQLGALFGAAKGVLWCLVITFFSVTLSDTARQAVLHSRSGQYTALLIQHGEPVLPTEVRAVIGKYLDELDRRLAPAENLGPAGAGQKTAGG